MAGHIRVACIQLAASSKIEENLQRSIPLMESAFRRKAQLVAFPENFVWRGCSEDLPKAAAQTPRIIEYFCAIARLRKTALSLGSLIESSTVRGKYFNTSLLISEQGRIIARYRKIHLFKIDLPGIRTDESKHISRGKSAVVGNVLGQSVGLSICYDLRFPELYRALVSKGANLLLVPSNFTYATGKAHWEILLRARAIENQAFVIAPAQSGTSPSTNIKSFGTSLMIDPWGKVLARARDFGEDVIFADLDCKAQLALRRHFPVLDDRVLKTIL